MSEVWSMMIITETGFLDSRGWETLIPLNIFILDILRTGKCINGSDVVVLLSVV